jgi:hypothetical protein
LPIQSVNLKTSYSDKIVAVYNNEIPSYHLLLIKRRMNFDGIGGTPTAAPDEGGYGPPKF